MIGQRSKVDFSEHEIFPIVKEGDNLITFKFANPKTGRHSVTFINSCGILAVTGDCGNWIFCRSFIPSHDGCVSDGYWCEKIRINSTQNPTMFSIDGTKKEILEMLQDEENKDEEEYLKKLLEKVDDGEFWYRYWASDNLPKDRDYEWIPECRELSPCLAVIFDAFDEVCRRIKIVKPSETLTALLCGPLGDIAIDCCIEEKRMLKEAIQKIKVAGL